MVEELIARRRELMMEQAVNPYEGFTTGRIYNGNVNRWVAVTSGTQTGSKVSPWFSVIGGHTVVYNYHSQGKLPKDVIGSDYAEQSVKIALSNGNYEGASNKNGYLGGRNTNVKNVCQLASNAVSIICCTCFGLDDFYIYDRTSGEYIYKGKNVTANSQ